MATATIVASSTRLINNDITEQASKHIRLSAKVVTIDVSWLGHFVFALDNQGAIYCFKNNFILNEHASTPLGVVNLMEYCMISGIDSLEVLLNIKSQMLDSVVDKFNENFNRFVFLNLKLLLFNSTANILFVDNHRTLHNIITSSFLP